MGKHLFMTAMLACLLTQALPGSAAEIPLPNALLEQIRKDHYADSERWEEDKEAGFSHLGVDLNSDKTPEIIVFGGKSLCGSSGCSFSIYRSLPNGKYQNIFDSDFNAHEDVIFPLATKTNKYNDILVKKTTGGGDTYVFVLLFDGKSYYVNCSCA